MLLMGQFTRDSPRLKKELDEFQAELARLQAKKGFTHFVQALQDDGEVLTVRILPASTTRDASTSPPPPTTRRSRADAVTKPSVPKTPRK